MWPADCSWYDPFLCVWLTLFLNKKSSVRVLMKGVSQVPCSHHHDVATAALRWWRRVGRGRDRLVGPGVSVSDGVNTL